jgi:50S ribosomal protein L16 3-hydroxylase
MHATNKKRADKKFLSRTLPLLGGLSADVFLRDYWQKKPLLIRNAIANFTGPLTKDEVLTLAGRDEAESRLIRCDANKWQLEHGPFSPRDFSRKKNALWTVLVQDVQHFSHEAHDLLSHFNFIPQARIDDLMVSYAVPGAGVGAHVDSYDVFLLQGMGERRWQISSQQDLRLKPGLPVKVLSHFEPAQDFVLKTGDMLYLPPNIAHNGIAQTECMTWSIGFRAPARQEISGAFLDYLRDTLQLSGQYADPGLKATCHPAQIDSALQRRITKMLDDIPTRARDGATIRRFAGTYLTEPKSHVIFDPPETPLAPSAFRKMAMRHGLELDLRTRMLYDEEHVFINGEAHTPTSELRTLLHALADQRSISAIAFAKLASKATPAFLYERYREGVLVVARD